MVDSSSRIDFGILLYVLHLLLLLALGRLLSLHPAELLVASSANIGGPATASGFGSNGGNIDVSGVFSWMELGNKQVRTALVSLDVSYGFFLFIKRAPELNFMRLFAKKHVRLLTDF